MVMSSDHVVKAMEEILKIGAAEFKAKCLRLLDEISERKRDAIIITKRGKPVARLAPVAEAGAPIYGALKGLAKIHGDLTEPLDVEWEALRR
jgi:prevent-host-death family protein